MPTDLLPAPVRQLHTWSFALLVCALAHPPLRADSDFEQTDYEIVCLDRVTGRLLWRTRPERLRRPRLTLAGDVLVVTEKDPPEPKEPPPGKLWSLPPKESSPRKLWFLDARSGELVDSHPEPSGMRIGRLPALPRNLERTDGTRYTFERGSTRHLTALVDGESVVVKHLEDFVADLHIFGDLALFTFDGTAGGEVFAFHLVEDRLAWEFDASKKFEVPEGGYTGIAVDGQRALVSTAQTLFALDARSGRVLWTSVLPKQNIRRYASPWTRVARLGDSLVIRCYEDLFVLDAAHGTVKWSFDCGFMGAPWPTVSGNRLYLAPRGGFLGLERPELRPLPKDLVTTVSRLPSAVLISRRRFFRLRFLSKRDVPVGEDVWWSLRPPPASRAKKRYTILFHQNYRNQRTEVDVSEPLLRRDTVYVKYYQKADRVYLLEDGEVVVEESVPSRWPPRKR